MTHSCNNLYTRLTECKLRASGGRRKWAQAEESRAKQMCTAGRHYRKGWQRTCESGRLCREGGRSGRHGRAEKPSNTLEAIRSHRKHGLVKGKHCAITAQLKRFAQGVAGRVRLSVRGYLNFLFFLRSISDSGICINRYHPDDKT